MYVCVFCVRKLKEIKMDENKNEIKKKTNNFHIGDSLGPILFGIIAVVIMIIAAHFMG